MNVLAVDPGKATGLASMIDGKWRAWIEPFENAQWTAHRGIAQHREGGLPLFDLVVFESIVITANTLKKSRDVQDAIEFIGVGRYISSLLDVRFETQTPSEAMSWSTDAKLRAMNWWTPGPDHANAASRHLLFALFRHKQLDLAALVAKLG